MSQYYCQKSTHKVSQFVTRTEAIFMQQVWNVNQTCEVIKGSGRSNHIALMFIIFMFSPLFLSNFYSCFPVNELIMEMYTNMYLAIFIIVNSIICILINKIQKASCEVIASSILWHKTLSKHRICTIGGFIINFFIPTLKKKSISDKLAKAIRIKMLF